MGDDTDHIIKYAQSLLADYVEHPLYSEHIKGLYQDMKQSDNPQKGSFVEPYLTNDEYMEHINKFMDEEDTKYDNPISPELRRLHTEAWKSPLMLSANVVMDNNNKKEAEKQSVPSNCVGLKDGEYSMRLIDDTSYPLVTAKCHNEYL